MPCWQCTDDEYLSPKCTDGTYLCVQCVDGAFLCLQCVDDKFPSKLIPLEGTVVTEAVKMTSKGVDTAGFVAVIVVFISF